MKTSHSLLSYLCLVFALASGVLLAAAADAQTPKVKAYRTLNFGDTYQEIEQKVTALLGTPAETSSGGSLDLYIGEPFLRALFPTEEEFALYWVPTGSMERTKQMELPRQFIRENGGLSVSTGANDTLSIGGYVFGNAGTGPTSGLAILVINYAKTDKGELVAKFLENYPKARKGTHVITIPSDTHPGVALQFAMESYTEDNPDFAATLTVAPEKFSYVFPEVSRLSEDDRRVWQNLSKSDGEQMSLEEYAAAFKKELLAIEKDIEVNGPDARRPLDQLTYRGWYQGDYRIFAKPTLVYRSKTIVGKFLAAFAQSQKAAADQATAKSKAEADEATKF